MHQQHTGKGERRRKSTAEQQRHYLGSLQFDKMLGSGLPFAQFLASSDLGLIEKLPEGDGLYREYSADTRVIFPSYLHSTATCCLASSSADSPLSAAGAAEGGGRGVSRASFYETAKRYVLLAIGQQVSSSDQAADDAAAGVTRLTRANIGPAIKEGEWVVLVHGTDPLSPSYLRAHTYASLASAQRGDGIHWGRVDYGAEGEVCTRWMIFRPPYLVFTTDQGQSLRFLSSQEAKSDGKLLDAFVDTRQWTDLPVWTSPWAPGGKWSWLVELYISLGNLFSEKLGSVPPLVWMLASGAMAQVLLRWMHSGSQTPRPGAGAGGRQSGQRPRTARPPKAI